MLSVEDIRHQKVPLWILVISVISGIIYGLVKEDVIMMAVNLVPGLILCILSAALPECIGMADGVVTIFYGLIFGWQKACLLLMAGFWTAAIVGIFWRCYTKRRDVQIPFIPFLALAHVGISI